MITKRIFRCSHCQALAREYFGMEGGTYIGGSTKFECPKASDGEHDFQPSPEQIPQNETPTAEHMVEFFGGIGAKVDVEHRSGDLFNNDFTGTIKGIHEGYITVTDQEDNDWDCSFYQLTYCNE